MTNKKSNITKALEERHKIYLGLNEEQISKDPHWMISNPLKGKELEEWVEYGVNTIMSELQIPRTQAEIEMSWVQASYGTFVNK
jgi:hypothetical protein